MIVMSFGFGEEHEDLYASIRYAESKDVLLFAAASNDGKNRPDGIAWPAKESRVICVHSADGLGTPSMYTPHPRDNAKIMVLGECVNSAWLPDTDWEKEHRLMSGTSCAAPIAAGIAALLLDYARGFLSSTEARKLRRVDSMRRLFEAMKDHDAHSGYWWIRPWALFHMKHDEAYIQGVIRNTI
jgi:hypothetical protein